MLARGLMRRSGQLFLGMPGAVVCAAISLTGFVVDTIAFYPGQMSPDTIDQYGQALSNTYTDWHPPVMAGLWHVLNLLYQGPQPMFFFQLLLLWGSCYLLMRFLLQISPWLSLLVPVLMCMPYVQNFAGVIWKDVHLGLSWLFALSVMLPFLATNRKMGKGPAVISAIFICYGCWVRANAFPALIPLACLWWIAITGRRVMTTFRQVSLLAARGVLLTIIVLLLQWFLNRVVLNAKKNYQEQKLIVHDLTGIYYKTGKMYFPDFVRAHPGFDTAYLKRNYRYSGIDNIWFNQEGRQLFPHASSTTIGEMRSSWLRAILSHPVTYFKNRMNGFINFLRIRDPGTKLEIIYPHIHPNDFGLTYTPNKTALFILGKVKLFAHTLIMKPYFWFFLNLVLLLMVQWGRFFSVRTAVTGIATSSLIYILFEFLVFPTDTDFRYFYINCLMLSLCIILMLAAFFFRKTAAPKAE